MNRKLVLATAAILFTTSVFAVDNSTVKETIPLADGSTVYVFKDGKMGMEDKSGRPARMQPGHVMKTKDGKNLIMIGDEVMSVDRVLGKVQAGG